MGIAAYNRGSCALSRALDAQQPSAVMVLLRDLSAYSARQDGIVPFAATVVRLHPQGGVCLMNRQAGGWRESAYSYGSLWHLARRWRLVFTGYSRDAHSAYFTVEPLPRETR